MLAAVKPEGVRNPGTQQCGEQRPAGEGEAVSEGPRSPSLSAGLGRHVGAGEGVGMVCASVLSVLLVGGWGCWGSTEGWGPGFWPDLILPAGLFSFGA